MVTMVTTVTGDSLVDISPAEIAEKTGITPQAAGQILKSLGIRSKLSKIDGISKRRILSAPDLFLKLKKRYLAGEEESAGSPDTNVTIVTNVTADPASDPKREFYWKEH